MLGLLPGLRVRGWPRSPHPPLLLPPSTLTETGLQRPAGLQSPRPPLSHRCQARLCVQGLGKGTPRLPPHPSPQLLPPLPTRPTLITTRSLTLLIPSLLLPNPFPAVLSVITSLARGTRQTQQHLISKGPRHTRPLPPTPNQAAWSKGRKDSPGPTSLLSRSQEGRLGQVTRRQARAGKAGGGGGLQWGGVF